MEIFEFSLKYFHVSAKPNIGQKQENYEEANLFTKIKNNWD